MSTRSQKHCLHLKFKKVIIFTKPHKYRYQGLNIRPIEPEQNLSTLCQASTTHLLLFNQTTKCMAEIMYLNGKNKLNNGCY